MAEINRLQKNIAIRSPRCNSKAQW